MPPAARRRRRAIRWLGNTMLLLGLLVASYLAYQLVWANQHAAQAAADTVQGIEREWQQQPVLAVPPTQPSEVRPGSGIALLRIPKLADQWRQQPVIEGVEAPQLAAGVGHYPGTALPGEVGNFAVAGHRDGHGQPFHLLDRLEPGDLIEVLTERTAYTYRVTGYEVVAPSQSSVLAAVPGKPGTAPTAPMLTLTTCHPRYSSQQRLIYYAVLDSSRPRA